MERWKLISIGAATAIVLALVVVLLWRDQPASDGDPNATPTPTAITEPSLIPQQRPTSTATPTAETSPGDEHGSPGTPEEKAKIAVANGFWDAWSKPGTPEERAARLQEWATPEEIEVAKLVAPESLPTSPRAGDATLDPNSEPALAACYINLADHTQWMVKMVKDPTAPHGWAVSYVEGYAH